MSPKHFKLDAPRSTQLNICDTNMVTVHGPLYVRWCLIPFHEAAKSLNSRRRTLNLGVKAINGLQICSLKPSELCTISFTFCVMCVFLCCDVSSKLKYLSSVYVAKNASATYS